MLTQSIKATKTLLCVAAVAALGAGCAADGQSTDSDSAKSADTLELQAPSSQNLKDPAGAWFASVVPNGTGCPPGSAYTSISPDGKTFTTTFSQYEAQVDENSSISAKDCQLAIKLHSPQGLSFTVEDFYYTGYAFLEQGVQGRQSAAYYFQGNPVQQATTRTTLNGPYDDTYTFHDQTITSDKVWSPCGTDRDLNVVTRVNVRNSNPRRNGYMNLTAIDGNAKVVLKLSWRKCN